MWGAPGCPGEPVLFGFPLKTTPFYASPDSASTFFFHFFFFFRIPLIPLGFLVCWCVGVWCLVWET